MKELKNDLCKSMACRICGGGDNIAFYWKYVMAMCQLCHVHSVPPISYGKFDERYWAADDDVPVRVRREFYSDYKVSGLSFERFLEETTYEV